MYYIENKVHYIYFAVGNNLLPFKKGITMGSLLALLSSVCYGTADFLGGYFAKKTSIGYVLICSQLSSLIMTALLALVLHGQMNGLADWLWSAAAGLSIAVSLPALYLALSIGPMAVVAPVTALIAIILPVLFGVFVANEKPSFEAYLGFFLGAIAVVIMSGAESNNGNQKTGIGKGLTLSIIAGTGIAAMYICLKQASGQSGMFALTVARVVSFGLLLLAAILTHKKSLETRPDMKSALFIAMSGGLDAIASVLYKTALIHSTQLSVVATLASLYPLTTVVLATIILRERLTWHRIAGIVLALTGIGLIV